MSKAILVRPILRDHSTAGMRVGETVAMWGHTFTLGKDRLLKCSLPEHIAKMEIRAGRVVRCDPIEMEPTPSVVEETLSGDADDYFGIKDKLKFERTIGRMRIADIQQFTEKHFNFTWPDEMTKADMVAALLKAVEELRA